MEKRENVSMENELMSLEDSPFGLAEVEESNVPQVNIGFSDDVLDKAVDYMEGKSQDLEFLDKFKADNNAKIKDFALISTASQLARIPSLIKMLNNVYGYLYSSNVLGDMDPKDLSNLGNNLSKEINTIMESSRKTIDSLERNSGIPSDYKELLDELLSQTPEELNSMKEFLKERRAEVEAPVEEVE